MESFVPGEAAMMIILSILGTVGGIIGIAAFAYAHGYRAGLNLQKKMSQVGRAIKRPDMVIELRCERATLLRISLWHLVAYGALHPQRIGQHGIILNALKLENCKLLADGVEIEKPDTWDLE